MHSLTDGEIDFILDDIAKKGIVTEDVKYNILDHVCCIIENEMPEKMDFYEFYRNTIARFYHKELCEIEDETRELTTFKYYYAMKRTLKITGTVTIILCLIGSIFKFLHLPGAGIMLVLSLGFFGLIFIPLNIILKFRDEKEQMNRLISTFGLILGMLISFGLLFKIFHWPGANMLTIGSLVIFALVFVPIYFFTRNRNPETKFNAIVHTTFMVAGAGLLFGMINLKPAHLRTATVVDTMDSRVVIMERMKTSNELLYVDLKGGDPIEALNYATTALLMTLSDIQTNLIVNSASVSKEVAEKGGVKLIQNPYDEHVITTHFLNKDEAFNQVALKEAIATYNSAITKIGGYGVLQAVEMNEANLTGNLSAVLNGLMDIELQVLTNENSFLCLQKGMLAQN